MDSQSVSPEAPGRKKTEWIIHSRTCFNSVDPQRDEGPLYLGYTVGGQGRDMNDMTTEKGAGNL